MAAPPPTLTFFSPLISLSLCKVFSQTHTLGMCLALVSTTVCQLASIVGTNAKSVCVP